MKKKIGIRGFIWGKLYNSCTFLCAFDVKECRLRADTDEFITEEGGNTVIPSFGTKKDGESSDTNSAPSGDVPEDIQNFYSKIDAEDEEDDEAAAAKQKTVSFEVIPHMYNTSGHYHWLKSRILGFSFTWNFIHQYSYYTNPLLDYALKCTLQSAFDKVTKIMHLVKCTMLAKKRDTWLEGS